jgi:hypothetical protein
MDSDHDRRRLAGSGGLRRGGTAVQLAPGKRTLTEALSVPAVPDIHAAAARGTATPASALPYADQIQRAFGRHDISGIQAHANGDAAASARAIGARAYATGDRVVLDHGADLHTVAHEAAHVVQQRGGVQLAGGVGAAGDAYERHADRVADRVVAGQSAEALLDEAAGGDRAARPGSAAVQRQVVVGGNPVAAPPEIAGLSESQRDYLKMLVEDQEWQYGFPDEDALMNWLTTGEGDGPDVTRVDALLDKGKEKEKPGADELDAPMASGASGDEAALAASLEVRAPSDSRPDDVIVVAPRRRDQGAAQHVANSRLRMSIPGLGPGPDTAPPEDFDGDRRELDQRARTAKERLHNIKRQVDALSAGRQPGLLRHAQATLVNRFDDVTRWEEALREAIFAISADAADRQCDRRASERKQDWTQRWVQNSTRSAILAIVCGLALAALVFGCVKVWVSSSVAEDATAIFGPMAVLILAVGTLVGAIWGYVSHTIAERNSTNDLRGAADQVYRTCETINGAYDNQFLSRAEKHGVAIADPRRRIRGAGRDAAAGSRDAAAPGDDGQPGPIGGAALPPHHDGQPGPIGGAALLPHHDGQPGPIGEAAQPPHHDGEPGPIDEDGINGDQELQQIGGDAAGSRV